LTASVRRIAANKQNAAKSTGPRTADGKARSSQNALKHGLTARTALLPSEDPAEFAAFCEELFSFLQPQGALEEKLVDRAVSLWWRLQRIPAIEGALFDATAEENEFIGMNEIYGGFQPTTESIKLGRVAATLLRSDLIGRLDRHEASLQRHFSLILKELRALQAARVDLPMIIDASKKKEHA
jgi:hypothetical protein